MRIEFLAVAEQELEDSADYYERQDVRSGADFSDEIDRALDALQENPQIGAPLSGGLRQYRTQRFPFNLIYSLQGDVLLVVAVMHQSREPNYWRDRI